MKLPVLMRHYQLYSATCSEGCWFDFLRLHYANTVHRGADPVHRQLPLQSPTCSVPVVMLMPGEINTMRVPVPDLGNWSRHLVFDEALLPADFIARLLRPPRV